MTVQRTLSRTRWDDRRARVLLSIIGEVVDPQVHQRMAQVGAVSTVAEILDGSSTLTRAAAYRARLPHGDPPQEPTALVDAALAAAAAVGGRVLVPSDPEWPAAVDDLLERRPYALWVRGPFGLDRLVPDRSVSIVGARAATQYGEHVAIELGADLAARGWAVVSGGAYGIDAAAHRGVVVSRGDTVAVLANGIDEVYPKGNAQLLERIAREGAVVSELPPGRHPTRQGFLARNRIIAALSGGTVVVEAAMRSGSASTVARALELGREVMAVPGPVTSSTSTGTHALLRDGATLVTCADDVVEAIAGIGQAGAPAPEPRTSDRDRLTDQQRQLLDAFPARAGVDEPTLAARAGTPIGSVLRDLGVLAVGGWVEHDGTHWRLTARARAA